MGGGNMASQFSSMQTAAMSAMAAVSGTNMTSTSGGGSNMTSHVGGVGDGMTSPYSSGGNVSPPSPLSAAAVAMQQSVIDAMT